MQVRGAWLVVGLAAIAALAWWQTRETPAQARAKQERAARAAAEIAEDARPVVYRWRDAAGVLQLTSEPPVGRRYERIPTDAPVPSEVRGDRE